MATKKTKQTKLDFKAPKGKVIVHIFVAVDEGGNVSTYHAERGETVESSRSNVCEDLPYGYGSADGVVVYQTKMVLDVPVAPKTVKKSVKAKKVDVPAPSDG